MPQSVTRAFLLWHRAANTGDWGKVLDLPHDADVEQALGMLEAWPAFRDLTAEQRAAISRDGSEDTTPEGWMF